MTADDLHLASHNKLIQVIQIKPDKNAKKIDVLSQNKYLPSNVLFSAEGSPLQGIDPAGQYNFVKLSYTASGQGSAHCTFIFYIFSLFEANPLPTKTYNP